MNKCTVLTALLYMALSVTSPSALSEPAENANAAHKPATYPEFTFVGEATMKWLWLEIYQAKLHTPTGTYQQKTWPLTLELIYARNINRDDLIDATIEDWDRQKITHKPDWISTLKTIWPNISKNDRLLLYVDDNTYSHFFYNDTFIGTLKDAAFAKAFTAIWLSNNTLKPELRNQLTGDSNE